MEYSDLFISYRRTHTAFIRQLHDALVAKRRSVWVDWEDIMPGSTDFTVDIQQGIECANAFVPVLTTDYLASEYCMNELNHAIANHKRLLPIVLEEIDEKQVPSTISHINWIYFHDHAGNTYKFEEALDRLLGALDIDQAYLALHTNLQVRAKEWAAHNRTADFALTGEPLVEAEKFIAAGVNKQPRPTDIQGEYIVASRAVETKRQQHEKALQDQARTRLRLSIATLALTLGLTIGGFIWFYSFTKDVVLKLAQSSLSTMVQTVASGIDGNEMRDLVDSVRPGDQVENDSRYMQEIGWLQRMHDIDPRMTAYTFIKTSDNQIAYVADEKEISDPSHANGYLEKEQRPSDAPIWDGFNEPIVATNVFEDANGAWVSAYAPIKDSSGASVGAAGLDMRLDDFLMPLNDLIHVIQVVSIILFFTVLIAICIFIIVRIRQHQALQPAV